jgi:hypothetical protein
MTCDTDAASAERALLMMHFLLIVLARTFANFFLSAIIANRETWEKRRNLVKPCTIESTKNNTNITKLSGANRLVLSAIS